MGSASKSRGTCAAGRAGGSRYTGKVSWRHRIALVLFTVLGGLQAAPAVCAMACQRGPAGAAHHAVRNACEETGAAAAADLSHTSGHDCGTHNGAVREHATVVATRADVSLRAATLVSFSIPSAFAIPSSLRLFISIAAPGTDPPGLRPFVLRV